MTDQGVMALQNCMALKKDVLGVCSDRHPAYSHEGTGDIRIKAEVVSDVEVEDNPVLVSPLGVKSEFEVSWTICVPTVMIISSSIKFLFFSHLHLSAHK
jgi:hypothetical protein